MKKNEGFWVGLERYGRVLVERSPLPWHWVGVGVVVLVVLVSALNVKNSVVSAVNTRALIEKAVNLGDYETAERLFDQNTNETNDQRVLGVESELEDIVYPERIVERRIQELEQQLMIYPGSRDLLVTLAGLYDQIGNGEMGAQYRESARVLAPND